MKELKYGTRHFSRMYEVYFEGLQFGMLRTEPRNNEFLDENWQQFKVVNERLYEVGYIDLCRRFFRAIGSQVRNVTRLDIAADGFGYMHLMNQFDSGMIDKCGKAKYTLYKDRNRKIEGFDLGSKASDKSITGYRKAEEIETKSNKHYIKHFWKKSGFKGWDSPNVERLEIRLKNNALIKIEDFDWTALECPEYLAGVMKKQMENFFDFRQVGHKNVSRAKKIEFINWDSVKAVRLEFSKARASTEYVRLKQTCKTMFWLYLGTRQSHFLQIAQEIAVNINCSIWFVEKSAFWRREFDKKNQITYKKGIAKKPAFEYIPLWEELQRNGQLKLTEKFNADFHLLGKIEQQIPS